MNRVETGKGQTLRISYAGGALPMDKESVFWLNVLEVPAKSQATTGENRLQMAFRPRIKLFFRPKGLDGNPNDAGNIVHHITRLYFTAR
ncbi:pili/flagellar assembly PapD-like chaperone [Serratia fonticola]|nr:pili/flagellar assembly PapD-like chaperone [Serratia fonticola]